MNKINASVENTELILDNSLKLQEYQINTVEIDFTFDNTWDNYDKYVMFENSEVNPTQTIRQTINSDGSCIMPSSLKAGHVKIQVYGEKTENDLKVKREPTNIVTLYIIKSIDPESKVNEWDLYLTKIDNYSFIVQNVQGQAETNAQNIASNSENITSNTNLINNNKEAVDNEITLINQNIANIQNSVSDNSTSISDIQIEQQTQNTNISQNTTNIINIKTEQTTQNNDIKTNKENIAMLESEAGNTLDLTMDSSTYVMTLDLKNKAGETLSTKSIDLPLETMVINAEYLKDSKEIQLTLQNGNTTKFSVADLIDGLASTTDLNTEITNRENQDKTLQDEITENKNNITTNTTDIANIKTEQETQNNNIEKANALIDKLVNVITANNSYKEQVSSKMSEVIVGNTTQNILTGKNQVPISILTEAPEELTMLQNEDGSITINGTVQNNQNIILNNTLKNYLTNGQKYYLSGVTNGGENILALTINQYYDNASHFTQHYNDNALFTANTTGDASLYIRLFANHTYDNVTIYPMIRLASIQDNSYEPYCGGISSPNIEYSQGLNSVTGNKIINIKTSDETKSYDLNLGEIKLNGINSNKDKITFKNGKFYITKVINETSIDKNTNFTNIVTNTDYTEIIFNLSNLDAQNNQKTMSNYFQYIDNNKIEISSGEAHVIRVPSKYTLTTLDDFKTLIGDKSIIVYYQLANTINEEITDPNLNSQLNNILDYLVPLELKGTEYTLEMIDK